MRIVHPSDDGNYAYAVGTGQYAAELSGKLYKAITGLTGDITHQYMLGYTPPTPFTERKFRSIKVAVIARTSSRRSPSGRSISGMTFKRQ